MRYIRRYIIRVGVHAPAEMMSPGVRRAALYTRIEAHIRVTGNAEEARITMSLKITRNVVIMHRNFLQH